MGLNQTVGSPETEAKEIRDKFKSRSKSSTLAKQVFAGVVWHIRKRRNSRVFNQKETGTVERIKLLCADMIILTQDCRLKDGQLQILKNWNV